jgi:Bacterial Ig domain
MSRSSRRRPRLVLLAVGAILATLTAPTAQAGLLVTANDDTYSVAHDHVLSVAASEGVLVNDTGIGRTAAKLTNPAHGTVTLNANGSFTYQPTAGYVGSDSFTYEARILNLGILLTDPATVRLTITNAAPTAANDSYSMTMGGTLTVAAPGVMANDNDSDGDAITATKVTDSGSGSVNLSASGGFTFSPGGSFTGLRTFTYRLSDGIASSNTATVSITVNAPAPTPTPTPPPATPAPTPVPTATPTPTPAPTPTPTPTPAATPAPTPTPAPTATLPLPTASLPPLPSLLPSILPGLAPVPTPTPLPSAIGSLLPTATPGPTGSSAGPGSTPPGSSSAPGAIGGPLGGSGSSGSGGSGSGGSGGSGAGGGAGTDDSARPFSLDTPVVDPLDGFAKVDLGSFGLIEWAVPSLVLSVPGLLLVLAVLAQTSGAILWVPVARRWLGGFGLRRRRSVGPATG